MSAFAATGDLAEQLASWRWSIAVDEMEDRLTALLADAALCALAAESADSPTARRTRSYVEAIAADGHATDWASGRRLDVASAALLNGVAIRALDLNDTHIANGIAHPSDSIAALVALGEANNKRYSEVLAAIGGAYETICRLMK